MRGYSRTRIPCCQAVCCFKSYPLAGVFPWINTAEYLLLRVSSHTPLRGYSQLLSRLENQACCFKSYPLAGVFNVQATHRHCLYSFKSYPLAGVFLIRFEMNIPGGIEKFQVIPPCGGIPLKPIIQDRFYMFQVIPPCGGIPHFYTKKSWVFCAECRIFLLCFARVE